MAYFIMYGNEDGGHFEEIDPDEFFQEVADGDWGEGKYAPKFLDYIPEFESWPENAYLLIKGEIVIPKPIQIVSKYTLE